MNILYKSRSDFSIRFAMSSCLDRHVGAIEYSLGYSNLIHEPIKYFKHDVIISRVV